MGTFKRSDAVFFVSGAAALVLQVVWVRLLGRLLGSDAAGLGIVLAVYMAGMGLGAWALAGRVARLDRPRLAYAGLELGIAAWAAASPFLLSVLEPVAGLGARALTAAAVLLPPTLAMGASFPLMGRLVIADPAAAGRDTSGFYGANTLGAAAGTLLAPFALLPALGLTGTLFAAAGLDLLAAALAVFLPEAPRTARRAGGGEPPGALRLVPPAPSTATGGPRARELAAGVLTATLLMGAAALGLEVLLTRLLISVTGASVYAFALVLAVFLLGIGLGSRQATGWLGSHDGSLRLLARAALAVAPLTLGGLVLLELQLGEVDLFGGLSNRMPAGASPLKLWASHALFAALALFPPALAFGAALPAAAGALVHARRDSPPEVQLGRVYAANTAGATVGSLLAAFVLLPALGPRFGLAVALAPCLAIGLLLPHAGAKPRVGALVATALLWLPLRAAPPGEPLVLHRFGRDSTVIVQDVVEGERTIRALRVNGKVVATTAPVDLRLQRLLGLIPGLLHGDVQSALVIGLGTGMTAGSLLALPTLEELTVYEISDAVEAGAREFEAWNGDVLDDPRTTVETVDGRHALLRAHRSFDLVTSDPIHPWTRGSSDLYSLEHFERMAEHLAPGGIASQWLPLYQLSLADVRTIVATWVAAFPHTSAWLTAYDLALVGSIEPTRFESGVDRSGAPLVLPPGARAALAEAGIHTADELLALRVADDADLRAFAAGTPPMREDRPVLEFSAPRSYLAGYCTEALAWAARPEYLARLPASARERGAEVRAALHRFLDRLPLGLSAAAATYGAELLALPPLER